MDDHRATNELLPAERRSPMTTDASSRSGDAELPTRDATIDAARRDEIGTDLAHTVLDAASRRLAEAVAAYDAALDRHARITELRFLDQEVARAERDVADLTEAPPPTRDGGVSDGRRRPEATDGSPRSGLGDSPRL